MLWVYDYKLLIPIPSLIQKTIDHMLKGKSCLDFNEFNSFHNKPVLIKKLQVSLWDHSVNLF